MKIGALERIVAAYASGLEVAKAPKAVVVNLRAFAGLLNEFSDLALADFIGLVDRSIDDARNRPAPKGKKPRVADIRAHLLALGGIVLNTPKSEGGIEIGLLIKSMSDDSVYLASMLDALKALLAGTDADPRIADFIKRLNADMGSKNFEDTLSELASSDLGREEVLEIARTIYGGLPKSTSRKAALGFIRKPHDARASARKGIEAQGGRSAA